MGVPAHDERDFIFAKKYSLPIQDVVAVQGKTYSTDQWQDWYGDKQQGCCTHSGKYDGLSHREAVDAVRSEEHTSELQSLMRISYAVFCLKTKTKQNTRQ